MVNSGRWDFIIKHYEQLIAEGLDFSPQLNVVQKIAISDYRESLFPTLSHNALNISRVENFHGSFEYPSICIRYIGEERFKISYSPNLKQTYNISKNICYFRDVWSYLESLFLRQKIDTGL